MNQCERPADLLVLKGAQPAGARRRCRLDPGTDGLYDEDVGESRDHGLTAWPELPGLGRHEREDALHPGRPGSVGAVDGDHRRQDPEEVAGDGMVEAHRSADQGRRRPALAVAENLVAVAGVLEFELHDPRDGDARLAAQDVPPAVW